ncbi:hypothetical protein ACS0TY_010338 [Phlomoides rotata]
MARDILAIPVSTVASESSFSNSGRLVSPHRIVDSYGMRRKVLHHQIFSLYLKRKKMSSKIVTLELTLEGSSSSDFQSILEEEEDELEDCNTGVDT